MSGEPTWFGPDTAPLFGVVHVPAGGSSRGGVVLCPPLGKEHVDTYRGLRVLGQRLAAIGIAVVRFDYLGTGDSAGDQAADSAVADYLASIRRAGDYLRACGAESVSLVGLRAGALLSATAAAADPHPANLVLWDPVTDGRRYLREQRSLYKLSVGEDTIKAGVESILGLSFSTSAAREIDSLKLSTIAGLGIRTLALARPERMDDRHLRALASTGDCTIEAVPDQAEFVEPASFAVTIPYRTIDLIVDWFDTHAAAHTAPFEAALRREATVEQRADGVAITETIEHFGPHQLVGIRTRVAGAPLNGPTILTHGTAYEHRIGSGRIWTELSREMACLGMTALRYDRRGTGDTPSTTSTELPRIYSDLSQDDVAAAVEAAGAGADRLMMAGVCSGAWNSAFAAITKGARSVVLINIIGYAMRQSETDPDTLAVGFPPSPGTTPAGRWRTAKALAKTLIRRHLPYIGWLALGRLGVAQVPEVLLSQLRRNNVATDIVLCPEDLIWFEEQRGRQSMARVSDAAWQPTLVCSPTGDHPMLNRDLQEFTRAHVRHAAERDFGPMLTDLRAASARGGQPKSTW